MSFAYPWVLLGLIVPALLVWAGHRARARRGRVRVPFDHSAPRQRRGIGTLIALAQGGAPLMLTVAVVVLAFPLWLSPPERHRKLTNIQLVLDVSGSMGWGNPSRYSAARTAIHRFTHSRDGDAMGLIIFGNAHVRLIPITQDLEAIRLALQFADPKHQPGQMRGTEIGAALRFAAKAMEADAVDSESDEQGDRVVILVSDGDSGDIQDGRHFEVANALMDAGVTMFYLHIGTGAARAGRDGDRIADRRQGVPCGRRGGDARGVRDARQDDANQVRHPATRAGGDARPVRMDRARRVRVARRWSPRPEVHTMVIAVLIAIAALVLGAIGEWLHTRRVRRVRILAFDGGRARAWAGAAPVVRVISVGAVVFGFVLLTLYRAEHLTRERSDEFSRRLLICLDVSPSMHVEDSGVSMSKQSRAARAYEAVAPLIDSVNPSDTARDALRVLHPVPAGAARYRRLQSCPQRA